MTEPVASQTERGIGRRFGFRRGWLLVIWLTLTLSFMYSGAVCHSPDGPADPVAAHLGWMLGGLSPVLGYATYLITRRWLQGWTATLLSTTLVLVLHGLMIMLLMYGMAGQPSGLG